MSIIRIRPPASLDDVLRGADPAWLMLAAQGLRQGKSGRDIDLLVHRGLFDIERKLENWRFSDVVILMGQEVVRLARTRDPERTLVPGVPYYARVKDATDDLFRLMLPEASIASSFGAGRSHTEAMASFRSRQIGNYSKVFVIPGGINPEEEAAARCGALIPMTAEMAIDRQRKLGIAHEPKRLRKA